MSLPVPCTTHYSVLLLLEYHCTRKEYHDQVLGSLFLHTMFGHWTVVDKLLVADFKRPGVSA